VPIVEQARHERIRIGDFPACGIQDKNAIVRRLEKPTVADFRLPDSDAECRIFGQIFGDVDIYSGQRFQG
jgi:hypothetical protein